MHFQQVDTGLQGSSVEAARDVELRVFRAIENLSRGRFYWFEGADGYYRSVLHLAQDGLSE